MATTLLQLRKSEKVCVEGRREEHLGGYITQFIQREEGRQQIISRSS